MNGVCKIQYENTLLFLVGKQKLILLLFLRHGKRVCFPATNADSTTQHMNTVKILALRYIPNFVR